MAKNADHAEQPVVNYLLAAEAAQQRGDEARANQHLERATELAGDDLIPVEITRVRLQLARNETTPPATASTSCWRSRRVIRRSLRLAEQAYIRTGAWNSLLDILPSMAKANVSDEEHRAELEQLAWIGLMDKTLADGGSEGLRDWWKSQNRKPAARWRYRWQWLIALSKATTAIRAQIIIEGLKKSTTTIVW